MKRVYVITQGQKSAELLKKLLPEGLIKHTEFVTGSDSYSVQSLARSILAVRQTPVALVVDTNTVDETAIEEKKDFLHEALNQVSPGVPFGVFVAVPEMEIVFFQEQPLLEKALFVT